MDLRVGNVSWSIDGVSLSGLAPADPPHPSSRTAASRRLQMQERGGILGEAGTGRRLDGNVETDGFSIRTAYYLAYASRCAYEERDDWVGMLGLTDRPRPFTCGQFHGFVGRLDRVALLALRGTQTLGNCLTDAELALVTHRAYPGRVHSGFAEAVDCIWPEVRKLLGSPTQTRPLWITGHSLGGAMATLVSFRLAREGYRIRAVYTYGSPRVGDRRFRASYGLTHYRFVNDNDLVPHLPFSWCYKHVGHLRLVDHERNVREERAAWRKKKRALAGQAKEIQRTHRGCRTQYELFDFDWLDDHRLDHYLEALEQIVRRTTRELWRPQPSGVRRGVPLQSVPAAPGPSRVRRPVAQVAKPPRPVLSDADFATAFFSQPGKRSGQPATVSQARR